MVTTPYSDFSTGELVASGATVITAPNTTHTFGVAAFDYEYSAFLEYYDDTLGDVCQTSDGHYCFLMDASGFLLYYNGIVGDVNDNDISHKFFGDAEPTLMQNLLDIEFFTNHTHSNYLRDSLDVSYTADEEMYGLLDLSGTPRSFEYNSGQYTVHQITGTNLYLVHIDGYAQTMMYPDDCPNDAVCASVRSPGCITDAAGSCVSVVADICVSPDDPTLPSVNCVATVLDANTHCMLDNGVQSDFCASDFGEECPNPDDEAVIGNPMLSIVSVTALVLLMR